MGWKEPEDGNRACPSPDQIGNETLQLLEEYPQYTAFLWEAVSLQVDLHGHVLEMGCGIGTISRLILKVEKVEALDAVDMNSAHVERVGREIADPRLRTSCSTAEEYYPAGAAYNCVVSINVLEHVRDDLAAHSNFQKVREPGGECLLLIPAHPSLYSRLDTALGHLRRYQLDQLVNLAGKAGFEKRRIVHFNPLGALGLWLNGKILRRAILSRFQVAVYTRFFIRFPAFWTAPILFRWESPSLRGL